MIRFLDRAVALPVQLLGPFLLFTLTLLAGVLGGLGWHFWPRWLPRASWGAAIARFFRGLRPSAWRRRARLTGEIADAPDDDILDEDDALPDRSANEFRSLADAYAAQGRYAEAVRERLRAVVRTLVDRGVIEHHPDWTVTELVAAAARTAPVMAAPLEAASGIFSGIWYGLRTATRAHDDAMRDLAEQVDQNLATPAGAR